MISARTLGVCREGKPVPTFADHALEPEINEFAVLLDPENPESQHRRGCIEENGALLPRAEPLAYGSVLETVAPDSLRVRSKPRDPGIDDDEYGVSHFTAPEYDLRGIGHLRQHVQRRGHAVGAKEHPCDHDRQERQNERGNIRQPRKAWRDAGAKIFPGGIVAKKGPMRRAPP